MFSFLLREPTFGQLFLRVMKFYSHLRILSQMWLWLTELTFRCQFCFLRLGWRHKLSITLMPLIKCKLVINWTTRLLIGRFRFDQIETRRYNRLLMIGVGRDEPRKARAYFWWRSQATDREMARLWLTFRGRLSVITYIYLTTRSFNVKVSAGLRAWRKYW